MYKQAEGLKDITCLLQGDFIIDCKEPFVSGSTLRDYGILPVCVRFWSHIKNLLSACLKLDNLVNSGNNIPSSYL